MNPQACSCGGPETCAFPDDCARKYALKWCGHCYMRGDHATEECPLDQEAARVARTAASIAYNRESSGSRPPNAVGISAAVRAALCAYVGEAR